MTIEKIIEITDNNNPASVMHDDPREAIAQVHALALGVAVAAKDTERLKYIALRISNDYWTKFGIHVMNVGGVGDLDDIRTFVDKLMKDQPLESEK